jgi:hypothetical protein
MTTAPVAEIATMTMMIMMLLLLLLLLLLLILPIMAAVIFTSRATGIEALVASCSSPHADVHGAAGACGTRGRPQPAPLTRPCSCIHT